ncbi:MAG: ABC transporter ATP-binding protein, partial [Opitutaceae bacterium]
MSNDVPSTRSAKEGDPARAAVLTARALRKTYLSGSQRLEVLRDITLEVRAGESISIRGESGSGKSTLLNLLSGLDTPDAGTIHWAGAAPAPSRRAEFLGMVFQSFYLIPELNAEQNVLMAARIRGRPGAAERARAIELLSRVGLAERNKHLPMQLSGGERQR